MPRLTTDVIQELLREMNRLVLVYPEGVTPIQPTLEFLIAGTAFFPGGTGLWRGMEAGGPQPEYFPDRPVMFLAHIFGDVPSFQQAKLERGEAHNTFARLWSNLLEFLAHADALKPSECFFTNAYMGLKSNGRSGAMPSDSTFKDQCIEFLASQVRIVDPRALVVLGDSVDALWRRARKLHPHLRAIPATKIMHPSARALNQLPTPEQWKQKQGGAISGLVSQIVREERPSGL